MFVIPKPIPLLLCVALTTGALTLSGGGAVRINEFMASSEGSPLMDEDGDRPDWIELFNAGRTAVSLAGYGLSDDARDPMRWILPDVTLQPGGFLVVFASGKARSDAGAPLHTGFKLDRDGEFLSLANPEREIEQAFDPGYVSLPAGFSYGMVPGGPTDSFEMMVPTPNEANVAPGPVIEWTDFSPKPAVSGQNLVVTTKIRSTAAPLASVTLFSATMFREVGAKAMLDNGVAPDEFAGDGVYSADISHKTIFAPLFKPGHLVRWYIVAKDVGERETRFPPYPDADTTEAFTGTIIDDPDLDTPLSMFHHFVESPARAETDTGTRAAVYYDGELYDNVFVRIRGGTARSWPKKSFKFEFPEDHPFRMHPDLPRVDEVNLNATYTDKSYARAILTTELHQASGTPSPITYAARVHLNGEFYSVALVVEQPDRDFLRRNAMDPDGAYYKAGPGSTYASGTGSFEKKTRRDESKQDLQEFLTGLQKDGPELEAFILDHVDIPAMINFLAGIVITQNIDNSDKNHYLYRDTNGTGEWEMTPWDLDLTFGPDALNTDFIIADDDGRGAVYPNASHPFIGTRQFPLHSGKYNDLIDAVLMTGRTQRMFLRRVRTLHDQFLATDYFDNRLDELIGSMEQDVALDREKWGSQSHFPGRRDTMIETVARIKSEYLERRRAYIERGADVEIPGPQSGDPLMSLGEVDFSPVSGNQDEYLELINGGTDAVDLSGWRVTGGIEFSFKPGTVIPGRSLFNPELNVLYLVKDVRTFRGRAEGPSGHQGLFVQGDYDGNLSNSGETIRLVDDQGSEIAAFHYEGNPSALETGLLITEILAAPKQNPDAEFIELWNRGDTTLDLTRVRFTRGVAFDFTESAIKTLEPGGRLLVVKDLTAFEAVFGPGLPVAGVFAEGTRLDNSGETIKLEDASNNTIQELAIQDAAPWPEGLSDNGRSMVLIDFAAPEEGASWRPSTLEGGTPGKGEESSTFEGDPAADSDGDGYSALAEYALGSEDGDRLSVPQIRLEAHGGVLTLTFSHRDGADDVEIGVQSSVDLSEWENAGGTTVISSRPGEKSIALSRESDLRFVRLRIALLGE